MNNVQIKLHYLQTTILCKLATSPQMRFNDLLIEGLESEHMNYHLKKLMELGLVQKQGSVYTLTDSGKDYSNLLDDEAKLVEKQPKTGILIRGMRENADGEVEHLLSRRLRQPYFGVVGRITGKVRFGETFQQAAERELMEETGLSAALLQLVEIRHKLRYRESGEFVQDVIFYVFLAKGFSGEFISKTPVQENFWITQKGLSERTDLPCFDDLVLDDNIEPKPLEIIEDIGIAENF